MISTVLSEGFAVHLVAASAVFGGVMAGFFFAYSASVVPALAVLPADAYAAVMQPINERIRNSAFGVAFFGAIAVPAACAAVVVLRGDWAAQYGRLFLAGVVVYAIGTIAVTVLVHFPMNDAIAAWDPASPPSDWAATRTRWARWNHVRTAAAIVSFVLYVGALASLGG
ncbi:DUF1772 domain-containing protein [Halosolutus gelatinilyticus]|uniref:anthrone oxygenase family protein n=1 Tax=Halosolutus gelatinilyticus TaxID=2931975 RepID=UPI001FF4C589|nr:anthrone oxygenase family protein [Halosolutus gelatinilyticus]